MDENWNLQSLFLVWWDIIVATHHRTFCRSNTLRIQMAIFLLRHMFALYFTRYGGQEKNDI